MIRATDLYITQALKYMLADIRRHQFLIRDILGDVVSDPILSQIYGEKEVVKFQEFIQKDIQINIEHSLDMMRLPAIAVRIGGGTEDLSKTGNLLSDGYESYLVPSHTLEGAYTATPRIILGPITPESYDSLTGKITFSNNVDLSKVYANMVVYDEINKKEYPIQLVEGDSIIYIKPNQNPNLHNCTIRSAANVRDKMINIRRHFITNENITLICIAVDPVEVIYLYQLVLYMIGRHRLTLFETKNFKVATLQYSPIYRLTDDPNIVFARDINLQGTVIHSYISATERPIEGLKTKLSIGDMTSQESYYQQANIKNQGWDGEGDSDS